MEDYKSFLSQGFVSINGSNEVKPVQNLRDMPYGCGLEFVLASLLPLSEHSSTDESVLSQGVKLGDIEIPLHTIYLK